MLKHLGDGDPGRRLSRKAIYAGGDRRERNRAKALVLGDRQARSVAIRQDSGFSRFAAAPDRPDRVDDMPGRQPVTAGQARLAWRAAAERAALETGRASCREG